MYAEVILGTDAHRHPLPYRDGVRRIVQRLKAVDDRIYDALLAGALTVIAVVTLALAEPEPPMREATWAAYVLAVIAMGSIAWRRRHPATVLLVATTATVALTVSSFAEAGTPFAVMIAFYSVASGEGRRSRWLGAGVLVAALAVLQVLDERSGFTEGDLAANVIIFSSVWVIGEHVRSRRQRLAFAEERADRLVREQEERERRAVTDERLRIAQELHDVVAHAMSVITVQAGVGAHVIDSQPAEAKKALAAIETTGRTALQELRRMVGLLRQDGDPKGERSPTPGLEDIEPLLARVRAAGTPVQLRWEGPAADTVPSSVSCSGYRVVQESLTNVLKHAGRASVELTVTVEADGARIEVLDDGRGAASRPDGHPEGYGLRGMRERVEVFGGTLQCGPRAGGGFMVRAWFPFGTAATSASAAMTSTPEVGAPR
jgi:signal transduction histidine kinase